MTSINGWMTTAADGLRDLLLRMATPRVRWNEEGDSDDLTEIPDMGYVESLAEAEAVGSLVQIVEDSPLDFLSGGPVAGTRLHCIAVDVDMPAWLVPSTNENHYHLYVPLEIPEEDLFEWLDASAKIGLLEQGYVDACKARGMTTLRVPWLRKGEEPSRNDPDFDDGWDDESEEPVNANERIIIAVDPAERDGDDTRVTIREANGVMHVEGVIRRDPF